MAMQTSLTCRQFLCAPTLAVVTLMFPTLGLGATKTPAAQLDTTSDDPIIVVGTRLPDIQPERELDEEGVSSYNESTIDGLLREIQSEIGDETEPLILVNGVRVNGLDDIGGLPVEALSNLKVLPRGSALASGGTSRQRVVSLTLKKKVRSATALLAHKIATGGGWNAERGEAILTYIQGQKRINVSFKLRDEDSLFESDRNILQPETPFAVRGNGVGLPDATGEIDLLLSAGASQVVTVAPVPGLSNPTLNDFAASVSHPALTDVGKFRTLRPDTSSYDLSGSFFTQLAPWLASMASIRFSRSSRLSARGLPSALFNLPTSNATSPLSTDFGLPFNGPNPLLTRSNTESGDASLTLNSQLGRWTANFNARHFETTNVTDTDRSLASGPVFFGDTINSFGDDLAGIILVRTDRAEVRSKVSSGRLSFVGPVLRLPAGDMRATIEAQFFDYRLRSSADVSGITEARKFHRSQWSLRTALDAPLISSAKFGDVDATAEASVNAASDANTWKSYSAGLAWQPSRKLRFRGEFGQSETPPTLQLIGDPIVATPGVRTFDPLTGDTVDVIQVTGGNPNLLPERSSVWQLSGQWTLLKRLNLQLNAEYTDTHERDFVSSVPEASVAVALAFPDRFIRNEEGALTTIDIRPVNFDSHREKRLRYGLSLNTNLTGSNRLAGRANPGPDPEADSDPASTAKSDGSTRSAKSPLRLQLNANHAVVLQDEISIRSGLGSLDLLKGGAIGIGSGQVRHQLDGSAALTSGGIGVRLGANWRGKYTLESRLAGVADTLRFSPVLSVNFRAFADVRRLLPNYGWARGARISVNVLNATNDRQEVRASAGNTPLQYQRGYRDPIGRSVELELRKVF